MVISDEVRALTVLERALGSAFDIVAFFDAAKALEWLRAAQQAPDLVICDVKTSKKHRAQLLQVRAGRRLAFFVRGNLSRLEEEVVSAKTHLLLDETTTASDLVQAVDRLLGNRGERARAAGD